MSADIYLLPETERPSWVSYPRSFCRLVEQGLVHVTPWHLLSGRDALQRLDGLASRYPRRKLFPFAYRQDNDDLACWSQGTGEKVLIIHDFSAPEFEDEGSYESVWEWFREAIEETIAWA